jgi:hypothetical protein
MATYSAVKPTAIPFTSNRPGDRLTGRQLKKIRAALDAAGRMHLACRIVTGRLVVEGLTVGGDGLTADLVADLCGVPPAYRERVRQAAAA